ncbi:hypothetical protein D9615_007111 [Tricholomella constricta]|uniref:Uncharacterized protein n=1 Tax=Tricholomella constricta TaxID=117010 RepID=A0A8H5H8P6_9AGAR|nr:hypothetical protein D9615_007111 [Tricholomella constricta]
MYVFHYSPTPSVFSPLRPPQFTGDVEEAARELYALANEHCVRNDAYLHVALQSYDRIIEMEPEGAADPQFIAQVRRSRISCYLRLNLEDKAERELDYMLANPVPIISTLTLTSTTSPPTQKWPSRLRRWASFSSTRHST